jgi:hypothetical protein
MTTVRSKFFSMVMCPLQNGPTLSELWCARPPSFDGQNEPISRLRVVIVRWTSRHDDRLCPAWKCRQQSPHYSGDIFFLLRDPFLSFGPSLVCPKQQGDMSCPTNPLF